VALTQNPESASYKALQGRSLLLIGLIDGIEGRHTASITTLQAAEDAFRSIRETPIAARLGAILAGELNVLGQSNEAWRRLYPSLIEPATFGRPEIRLSVYLNASLLAREEGEMEIALWFQDEVLKNLQLMNRQEGLVGELCKHASLLGSLGRKTEAAKDLAQARVYLQQIPDPTVRRGIEGDLLLAESDLATYSPRQAIAKLDEAIQIFRATSYYYRLGHALYQRAQAEKALGQNDAAERDLAAAIAESERQRETIAAAGDRISYLDRQKELFDTMVAFQLEQRRRPDVALRFSEQAKARVLWDWMLTRPAQKAVPASLQQAAAPLDLPSSQRSLPEGTVVVEYAVLPRKTILWVLGRQGEPQWQTSEFGAAALGDLVQQFRRALLDHRSADVAAISQRLYDVLIRPVTGQMAPGERLVLIPDGVLHTLPFTLLRDRQSGRYLIQDHVCAVAPSVRVFAASRQRDAELDRRSEKVLVAAAPDFDRTLDPSLLPLKSGATDASIARIFPGSQVLQGPAATREAFLQAAGDFEVLHFAGHSLINTDFPLLSQMLFAQGSTDPNRGVLYSGDILEHRFPSTRLAVLASCSTAAGRISRTEGVESLARPFLAAGVPTVIAALWDVDDQVTADFFVRFYHHLAERFDVAGALQATQIDALEQGMDPKAWGAFEVIGGSAIH
jgi:CHAT domain-containing protein